MTLRDKYYTIIKEYNLGDVLIDTLLSYSQKIHLLTLLLDRFKCNIVSKALNEYHMNYISLNRDDIKRIKPILMGLCKKQKEGENNE